MVSRGGLAFYTEECLYYSRHLDVCYLQIAIRLDWFLDTEQYSRLQQQQ